MEDNFHEVESTSPDYQTQAAHDIAQLFPQAVSDGKIDIDVIKTLLGEDVSSTRERFGLFWPGKNDAMHAAQIPTTATLAPDLKNSVDWDRTDNIFIEGDNLEVLKILQKHYYGKIKCIYIDPPYNTGKDFVYPDNFSDSIANYLEVTGQSDGEGKISTNASADGRFHSTWLNMMYPRLVLARNLLKQDGVIFISIDANEQNNLQKICDEIFGESNRLGTLSIVNNLKGRSDDEFFATSHEFLLVYSRSIQEAKINGLPASDTYLEEFKFSDGISNYKLVPLRKTGKNSRREDRPNMYYPIYYHPELKVFSENPGSGFIKILPKDSEGNAGRWRWGNEKFVQYKSTELVAKESQSGWSIYVKMRDLVDGEQRTVKPKTTWLDPKFDTAAGARSIKEIFYGLKIFDTPKPLTFIDEILRIATNSSDDIILDFFAGSGTTAHAVMQLNAEDGGHRRCISVQLPEPTPENSEARKAGFETIADISRERIRRAGAKILDGEREKEKKRRIRPLNLNESNESNESNEFSILTRLSSLLIPSTQALELIS